MADYASKCSISCGKQWRELEQEKRDLWMSKEVDKQDLVHDFLHCSKVQQSIVSILDHSKLREQDVLVLRRYCMCRLLYENVQRSGTLKNATLNEFHNRVEKEDHSVMFVKKHKTCAKFGSAKIVIPSELVSCIKK